MEKLRRSLESSIMNRISSDLNCIKQEIISLKDSITFINSRYDDFSKTISTLEKNVKSFATTATEVSNLKDSIKSLENDNNTKEQWSRRSNIEIYGIPEKKGENLFEILKVIGEKFQFPLNLSSDLDFITRVAPKDRDNKQIKPIVVRFQARYKKDDFLTQARKLKLKACDIGYSGNNSFIHFNDHLTRANKVLLKRTKELAKERNYKFVWVKNCSIMVRQADNTPLIHISDYKDLNKIK
ncbi:uncharacterized protein LOC123699574 [Colias croceus]|uniref:uncharacterized protein LOC123699574 n=1 Tax=Colias crocea TaxID=72248 RepID=UPI001E27C20D|nr:uncharacterized protein LOC123699574 [Colias croceus]